MPAVIDLDLGLPVVPTVYPARLHGAACAILGHPPSGSRPAFATQPPQATSNGARWRLGWLDATPCPPPPRTVTFGDAALPVLDATVREWSHAELTRAGRACRAEIDVLSPMYFSRGDRDHPAPDAVLALRSLLDRWDAFAPAPLVVPAAARAALLDSVYLVGMQGGTVTGAVGKKTYQTGYVGTMTLALTRSAPPGAEDLFATMIRFARIAGIGAQTGHGFGAVTTPDLPREPRADRRRTSRNGAGARNPVPAAQRP